jgi:flagellar basal-body rod protein FlgB
VTLFGPTMEMLRQAAVFSTRRHEVLARNIANADTPGFQPRDLTFAHELSLAQQVRALPAAAMGTPDLDLRLIEGRDSVTSARGKSVDVDRQMTRLAQNALYHSAVLELLNVHFRALKSAINGHAPETSTPDGNPLAISASALAQRTRSNVSTEHPEADGNGHGNMANVSPVGAMVDGMAATRAYEANVSAIQAARSMAQKALELGR